jgi:hypothetical protein
MVEALEINEKICHMEIIGVPEVILWIYNFKKLFSRETRW